MTELEKQWIRSGRSMQAGDAKLGDSEIHKEKQDPQPDSWA